MDWRRRCRSPLRVGSVSTLALCGVPFFSGFFSKDEIIDSAHAQRLHVFFIRRLDRCIHDHCVHDQSYVSDLLR